MDSWFEKSLKEPEAVDVLKAMPKWVVHSDKEYGGSSEASLNIHDDGKICFEGCLREHKHDVEANEVKVMGVGKERVVGSFCALKAEYISNAIDLVGYEGLEVVLESSVSRSFSMNLTCMSVFEDDVYQFPFELEAGKKSILHIPFSYFKVTAGGRQREFQREADSLQLESIGFLAFERGVKLEPIVAATEKNIGEKQKDPTEPLSDARMQSQSPPRFNEPFTLNVISVTAMHHLDYATKARLQLSNHNQKVDNEMH